jgi:hypothetical protein
MRRIFKGFSLFLLMLNPDQKTIEKCDVFYEKIKLKFVPILVNWQD